jgi:hypothetical protein
MIPTWTVEHGLIPEYIVAGKRLGRHIRHDSRSLAYRHVTTPGRPLVSVEHARHTPILNQGGVGSCTGNAETGALGSDPLWDTIPAGIVLDENMALSIYSAAETIDGDGPYPPNDNGSTGLSVAQAAKAQGLIAGYTHCFTARDIASALQDSCVIFGVNWYDSFDRPDSSGLVAISPNAVVRGGHEIVCRRIDVENRLLGCDNSWGTGYGAGGSFTMSWDTAERLLAEQGDAVVNIPLGQPAPVPAAS